MRLLRALAFVATLLAWREASACAVCLGSSAGPLLDAARLGVLTMVVITVAVLLALARWFLRVRSLQDEDGP